MCKLKSVNVCVCVSVRGERERESIPSVAIVLNAPFPYIKIEKKSNNVD